MHYYKLHKKQKKFDSRNFIASLTVFWRYILLGIEKWIKKKRENISLPLSLSLIPLIWNWALIKRRIPYLYLQFIKIEGKHLRTSPYKE